MSDAKRPDSQADELAPDAAPTDIDGNPVPSEETLAQQALPAVYTRSPRFIRVIVTSAAVVAFVGAIAGFILPASFLSGRFTAAGLLAIAGAVAGALVAGAVVAANERVEARHVADRRRAAIEQWIAAHPDADLSGEAKAAKPTKATKSTEATEGKPEK